MFLPVIGFILTYTILLIYSIAEANITKIIISSILIISSIFYLFYGYGYGIKINYEKRYIRLRTAMHKEKINFSDIKYISYQEVKKEKAKKSYAPLDYYMRNKNFHSANYTFNEGKVFNIAFHFKSGWKKEVEFAWMYKEKLKSKVESTENQLKAIIDEFNNNIRST